MRHLVLITLFLLVNTSAATTPANETGTTQTWREGVHYTKLANAAPRLDQAVEVIEMFSYSCGVCNAFEPKLVGWIARKPKDVRFVRMPVTWGPFEQADARLFFAIKVLHREDLHQEVFDAIHKERKTLSSPRDEEASLFQTRFAVEHGVLAANFLRARNSHEVNQAVANANDLVIRYKVVNTPTIIVDGKYTTTIGEAGGSTQLLALIDYLVALERHTGMLKRRMSAHSGADSVVQ